MLHINEISNVTNFVIARSLRRSNLPIPLKIATLISFARNDMLIDVADMNIPSPKLANGVIIIIFFRDTEE